MSSTTQTSANALRVGSSDPEEFLPKRQAKPKRHVGHRGDLPVPGQLAVGVDGFAKMVGISTVTAYRLLKNGEIPAIRLAGRTLIAVAEIEKLIADRSGAFVKRGA